jgi:DNA-binding SARP family transcriptional activator
VDVEEFLADTRRGLALLRAGETDSAASVLEKAQSEYDGDFLEEDLYTDWSVPLREEARNAYVSITRALAKLFESAGDRDSAAHHWRRLLERDGWNTEAHLGLARCLAGQGRHGEARRRYEMYRARMDELGVEAEPFPHPTRPPAAGTMA